MYTYKSVTVDDKFNASVNNAPVIADDRKKILISSNLLFIF